MSDGDGDSTASMATSILDKIKDGAATAEEKVSDITTGLTDTQIIGIAVGSGAVVLLLLYCCCRRCRMRKVSGKTSDKRKQHRLTRPYVERSGGQLSQGKLPVGCILHGATKLHAAKLDGKGVKVAVIDSGIDDKHPGFHGKAIQKKWFRHGTSLSEDDHGTHVAGTIHFLAPQAELHDYRVFGENGIDGDKAIAESIRMATDDGCQIINMSLRVSYPVREGVEAAVKYAAKKGVIMVCAAGNSGDGDALTNEMYAFPARWKETISVAAVSKKADLPVARFSESNTEVDCAAIGVEVVSLKPGGGFQTMQGTSMAAPHVSGVIACLMSNGSYKRNGVKKLRKDLANKVSFDIGQPGRDNSTGVGFVSFLSRKEFDRSLSQLQETASARVYCSLHQC